MWELFLWAHTGINLEQEDRVEALGEPWNDSHRSDLAGVVHHVYVALCGPVELHNPLDAIS